MKEQEQAQQPQKFDWDNYVGSSEGRSIFLPDKFKKQAEKVEKQRADFNELLQDVARQEIELNMATQNMFFEIRKHLHENGMHDIFVKDIGFDSRALQEGLFVLNLRENQK